ncbi:bifunctional (p)ppGpp synthetase/guanosine-3',5'-bis(diphosphate) 3'-pyrophosphohydrolase [Alkalicella caledoniensis]|uniref:GTP diphosphokinase n=1 Tax=Alkalicella caledoniensis TaxID=2731377 RepID=A0A7G9WAN5_ALKCA|nr:bifunctional (p)ppGpp synthetase/guanosine-3',5'-bis(diphosphate) 3'-pyrophosphohydrolase [Alkalicella caledoniensis]QNO15747.1 bifunctional (p)ppGpp synthetase/guanosine-3',5'-bis(diphosphate) 3'-pyrophosphohydrolase [Alkalicella caledoniensis]
MENVIHDIEVIKRKITARDNETDLTILDKAYTWAEKAHKNQLRESGDSFIVHPLGVANILVELEMDVDTIAAAILHDVVEDTEVTLEAIQKEFGEGIALLVDGVTKLSQIEFKSKEEQQAESFRKMFMAMAKDIRVIIIKLADRLHNMRTLNHTTVEKQKRMAKETLEIYAPLAHRMGIFKIKWELEDLAFRYTLQQEYYNLAKQIAQKREEREKFINDIIAELNEKADAASINATIDGRPKHLYSIYQKMHNKGKELNEIYDLTAVRIIVESVRECYGVLGIIHSLWKPIPGRFKDYIAMPKPNMYQSLHTTVLCPKGNPLEIQIRTWDMHKTAEFGVAAHWQYKEQGKADKHLDQKRSWFRQFMEWQRELKDAHEYMESLKIDLFNEEVFVFTPRGDVIDLPSGGVPLDFAYRVHTDVGHRFAGAKVNGNIVQLNYNLKTGDIVEIMTKPNKAPSRDWLQIVKTSHAKSKIRAWFKKESQEENIEKGKELLEKEIKKLHYDITDVLKDDFIEKIAKRYNYSTANDVYSAIGFGGFSAISVAKKLIEEFKKTLPEEDTNISEINLQNTPRKTSTQGVRIKGVDNLLIRFSKCCKPVPGDEIVGYITRGRGVSIHRKDCTNISPDDVDRFIEVEWDVEKKQSYPVELSIFAWDRKGLLQEVMNTVSEGKANIVAVSGKGKDDGTASIRLTVEITDTSHLEKVKDRLRSIQSVFDVVRHGNRGDNN